MNAARRGIARVAFAPIWALQLLTGAKSFLDNPLIGSRRLNQRGLHVGRVRLADAMNRWRRRRLARRVRADWREAFDRDGFVAIRDIVPPQDFPALREAILRHEAPAREMRQGDAITRRMAIDPAMLAAIPALGQLLARPDIVALLHYVAGFRTTPLHYVQTIVSHVDGNEPDPQETIHADSFHSSLKSWLFLNDVAADEGPFTYVRGSHRFTPERLAWEHQRSLADPQAIDRLSARGSPRVSADDLKAMNLPEPEGLAVPANTLVVADTVGFHARGLAVRPGERVEIWSYSRRNPFLPWLGGDLLSLPGIAERRIGWVWALRDRFEARIGQPWKPVGKRRAVGPLSSRQD
ncbi:MAG: phytanoyl-CoA dioxygenase family protein [Novosphingobium sp.]|uniref:phytanoyl-CoA dioxygenase family protein n=1 Tax=Novosphingobium sp. TaxID=1874826 RepID=UPI003B9C0C12